MGTKCMKHETVKYILHIIVRVAFKHIEVIIAARLTFEQQYIKLQSRSPQQVWPLGSTEVHQKALASSKGVWPLGSSKVHHKVPVSSKSSLWALQGCNKIRNFQQGWFEAEHCSSRFIRKSQPPKSSKTGLWARVKYMRKNVQSPARVTSGLSTSSASTAANNLFLH